MSLRAILKELPETLKLALPISLGMLSHMLIQLTDTLMLGHYGTVELAAGAFAGSLTLLVLYLGLGFGQAITVLASQALGAGQPVRARGIYHLSATGSLLYGAAGIALTLLALPLFDHMGQPAVVAAQGKPFAILLAVSFVPTLLFQNLRSYYEALKKPWVPFVHMIALLLLNIFFNWLFIFGHWGMPELGIVGSGLGTLLARTGVAAAFLVYAHRRGQPLEAIKIKTKDLPIGQLPRILTIAAAHGLQMTATLIAYVVGGVWIGTLGAEEMSANRLVGAWDATLYMLPLGLGSALAIRIGRSRGAGDLARTRHIYRGGFLVTAVFAGVVSLGMALFPQALAGAFSNDPAVQVIAEQLILIAAIFCLFDNLASVTLASLRGLGDVVVPALTYLGLYWLLAMPLAWLMLFRWHMGAEGVWWSYCTGITLGCVFLILRFGWLTKAARIVWSDPDKEDLQRSASAT